MTLTPFSTQKVVFRMYWVKGDRDVPAVYQNRHLRKAITAVLQQLYDRKYVCTYYTPPRFHRQGS